MSNLLTRVSELIETKKKSRSGGSSSLSFLDFCEQTFSTYLEKLNDDFKTEVETFFSLYPQIKEAYPWAEGDLIDSEKLQNIEGKILLALAFSFILSNDISSLEESQLKSYQLFPVTRNSLASRILNNKDLSEQDIVWTRDSSSYSHSYGDKEGSYWLVSPLDLSGTLYSNKLYYLPVCGNGHPDTPTTYFSFYIKEYTNYNGRPDTLYKEYDFNALFSILPKTEAFNLLFAVVVPREHEENKNSITTILRNGSVYMTWEEEAGKWTGKTNINSYVSGIATIDPTEEKILFELGVTEKDVQFKKYPKLGVDVFGVELSKGVSAVGLDFTYDPSFGGPYSQTVEKNGSFVVYDIDSASDQTKIDGDRSSFTFYHSYNGFEFQAMWFDNPYYEES